MNITLNKEKYKQFVEERFSSIPIFFYADFLDAVSHMNWQGLVIEDDNTVIGVFIIHEKYKLGLKCLLNPSLSPYCGLWLDANYTSKSARIIPSLAENLKSNYCYINFTLHHSYENHLPWSWQGFHQNQRMTMILSPNSYSTIYSNYDATLKSEIRYAQKTLKIELVNQSDQDVNILINGMVKSGMKDKIAIQIIEALNSKPFTKTYKAVDEKNLTHGILMHCEDAMTSYNLINGRANNSIRGTMAMLIDHIIHEAMDKGKYFDFEGSSLKGVYNFFKPFNPTIVPYHQLYKTKNTFSDALIKTFNLI